MLSIKTWVSSINSTNGKLDVESFIAFVLRTAFTKRLGCVSLSLPLQNVHMCQHRPLTSQYSCN